MKKFNEGTYKRYNRPREVVIRFQDGTWSEFNRRGNIITGFGHYAEQDLERTYDPDDGVKSYTYKVYDDVEREAVYAKFQDGTWYRCTGFGTVLTKQSKEKGYLLDDRIEDE